MMLPAISRNAFLLAAFAIISTGAVAIVSALTQSKIAEQQQLALQKSINEIIDSSEYDNPIINSCFYVSDEQLLGDKEPKQVFIARKNKQPVAALIETSTFKGYSGEIKMLVGIYTNGKVAGVRVNSHTETPGLGDKIQTNKSDWILAFSGKNYQKQQANLWEVKKDGGEFDAFTGATITPRAVVHAVRDSLIYFQNNQQMLFNHLSDCQAAQ